MTRNGWHDVNARTRLLVADGKPTKVETTAYDLDAALDSAAQFWGAPLERNRWLTDDGRDPEDTDTGDDSKVTCNCWEAE